MEATQPTERTPLIGQQGTTTSTSGPGQHPFILELERDIYSDSEYPAIHRIIERKVDALDKSPSTVLTLKLLLCLRYLSGAYFRLGRDNWVDSRSAEEDTIDLATRCWADLQRIAWSQAAIDEALWTEFPLENGNRVRVSLIETVLSDRTHFLPSIQLDDRIALSLLRTWRKGRPSSALDARDESALFARLESFATPRVLHLIDVTVYLVYLAILLHYLMLPTPIYPDRHGVDYHFYSIVVYSASGILRDKWPSATLGAFVLTLATMLSALPNMPTPRDNSYNVLLLCSFMHVVQLLLPFSPSISLLVPQSATFTIAIMLSNLFTKVFIPALAFFIPIIIVLLFILALSLHDIFMRATGLVTFDLFLFCLWCAGLFFTCLTAYMTLSFFPLPPAKFHHPGVPASWDSFGPNVGISLRRQLCNLVATYSTPHIFPAPFNLIPLVLIRLPSGVLLVFRDKYLTTRLRTTVEPLLWRVLMLPLVFIFGVVWLWK